MFKGLRKLGEREQERAQAEKARLRARLSERLKMLPEAYLAEADEAIARQVLALPAWETAGTVFCFPPAGRGPDTGPILEAALAQGKRLAVPRRINGGLEACRIERLEQLKAAEDGCLEPEAGCPPVPPDGIDFAAVPCLSCNLQGWRLGSGRGGYERWLEGFSGTCACLCREAMLEPDIPVRGSGRPVDLVVTERGVCRAREL